MKGYNGLESRTTALILNISKEVSKQARLLYNAILIKMHYYSRITLNYFATDYSQNYSGIIDKCLTTIVLQTYYKYTM